jgi:hypothetical protein
MWIPATDLPTAASHPFYRRLNQLLREHGFDDFVEAQSAGFYAETMGRPGLPEVGRVAHTGLGKKPPSPCLCVSVARYQ